MNIVRKTGWIVAVLGAALPMVLSAQSPRLPRPWWDHQVTRSLNLSEAQTGQIRQIQNQFRPRMMDLRNAVTQADTDLKMAFNEDPVDQVKANDAINRLAAARADLTKAVSQMDLQLRMILTAQQWQELNQRQRGRGMRRRGPPGSPGSSPANPSQQK